MSEFKVGDWVKKKEIQETFRYKIDKEKWDELPDCFQIKEVTEYAVYGPNDYGFFPDRFEKIENPNNEPKKTQNNENGKLWTVAFDLPLPKKPKGNEMSELKIGDEFEVVYGFYSEKSENFSTKDIVVYEGICPTNKHRHRFHCKANKQKIFTLQPKDVFYHLKKSKKDMKYTIEQIKHLQEILENRYCHPDIKEFISKTLDNQRKLHRKEFLQGFQETVSKLVNNEKQSYLVCKESEDFDIINFMFEPGNYHFESEKTHYMIEITILPYSKDISIIVSRLKEINVQ